MKFTEKAALATGALSLMATPMAADAAVIAGSGPVSVSFADLPGGTGFQSIDVAWDVDGVNGADFYLFAARTVSSYATASGAQIRTFIGYNGIGVSTYSSAQGNGVGLVANTSTDGLARLAASNMVGPAQYLVYSADAVGAYVYRVQYSGTTYSGGSATAVGGLLPGLNKIGFAFDVSGNTHYGFAEIILHDGPDFELEVTEWWYEDEADTEIHITPLPSSGIAALTLLGLGAAGLRAQRKRKAA